MPIYVNGQKVKAIYSNGQSVGSIYSEGQLVFTKKQGWQQGPSLTLTVNSANNNSVAGTMTFYRYDYYEGSAITESYYQVASRELSRPTEGVVSLNLGAGTAVVFGNAASNADYAVPTNGTIRLSASELNTLFRIRNATGSINLGASLTVTSNYLEPVQDMAISQLGSDLYLTAGWAISSNRTSRIKTNSAMTVALSNLSVPKEGTWPVYAIAPSGTEVTTSSITCSTGAHYTFDAQNIRHLGWVTVSAGNITNVISINSSTGSGISKSISGSTLTVGAGYATDTDGCKVYVPGFTYSFADMVTAAKDTTTKGSKVTMRDYSTTSSVEGPATVQGGTVHPYEYNKNYGDGAKGTIPGPCELHYRHRSLGGISEYRLYAGTQLSDLYYTDKTTSTNVRTYNIPSGTEIYVIQCSTKGYTVSRGSTKSGTVSSEAYYYPITTVAGKTQTRNLYVKVTRNQNNSSKTTATQTSTGDSSPYVSYINVGTITVTRNSSTGTIS